MSLSANMQALVAGIKAKGLYRRQRLAGAQDLQFASNDYLGLARHPLLAKAYAQAYSSQPCGSGGSALVSGYHGAHQALEQAFAEFLQVESCLFLSSGYVANLSVMALLAAIKADILIDKAVHASIYDGLTLHQLSPKRYLHQDLADFARKLARMPEHSVVITEGLFSMSGEIAALASMADLMSTRQQVLLVDEAHSFGILGAKGRGAVAAAGLDQKTVPLRVIPLGKAMAGQGAILAGEADWIDALLQVARPYIYSTAASPAQALGLKAALSFLAEADEQRAALGQLIAYFRRCAKETPWNWRDSHTPIQQLRLGCPFRAQSVASALQAAGIFCIPMRQPTVSREDSGLRISLNAGHRFADIDRLFSCLNEILHADLLS